MKNHSIFFPSYYKAVCKSINTFDIDSLEIAAKLIIAANSKNRKIIFVGNGGSAAIASHLSVDLTKAGGIRAINFNESDLLTCFSNDYGYENWVSRALNFYADEGDVVFFISSSGNSQNIIICVLLERKMDLTVITLSGF